MNSIPQPQAAPLTLNDALNDAFAPISEGREGYTTTTGDILPSPQTPQLVNNSVDGVEMSPTQYQVRIALHIWYTLLHNRCCSQQYYSLYYIF